MELMADYFRTVLEIAEVPMEEKEARRKIEPLPPDYCKPTVGEEMERMAEVARINLRSITSTDPETAAQIRREPVRPLSSQRDSTVASSFDQLSNLTRQNTKDEKQDKARGCLRCLLVVLKGADSRWSPNLPRSSPESRMVLRKAIGIECHQIANLRLLVSETVAVKRSMITNYNLITNALSTT